MAPSDSRSVNCYGHGHLVCKFPINVTVPSNDLYVGVLSDGNNLNGAQVQVFVRDNNVDQALRILKKKMQREGVIREMKLRRAYEKPSERRTREKAEAIRRARKLARKKAQREGLIPMPKRREDVRRRVVRAPTF